jgi:hypothetical protein
MLGMRSLNLDLTSLDPEFEKTLRRRLRNSVGMGEITYMWERMSSMGEKMLIILDHLRICLHQLR